MKSFGQVLAALALGCFALSGCVTSDVRKSKTVAPVVAGSEFLIMQPDVQLSVQTVAGQEEPRADWSLSAKQNLDAALNSWLESKRYKSKSTDPATMMEGRVGQVIRLNEAVGSTILAVEYGGYGLPTKKGLFDWSLGPGTQLIQSATGSRYALFFVARGAYADAGRVAASVGLAFAGVSLPLAGQYLMASMVDLETGKVVWFNVAVIPAAGPDMRDPKGAQSVIEQVMKDAPQ